MKITFVRGIFCETIYLSFEGKALFQKQPRVQRLPVKVALIFQLSKNFALTSYLVSIKKKKICAKF